MELLITLGILGGIFALGAVVLGFAELSVYLVASIKAFPVKVENVYNKIVESNKELLEKIKSRKVAKQEAKEKARKEKLAKREAEVLASVKEEVQKVEEVITETPVEAQPETTVVAVDTIVDNVLNN